MKIAILKIRKIIKENKIIDFFIALIFVTGIALLIFYIQKTKIYQPQFKGVYREGLYEPITNLNPLSPKNDSEKSIINIIYPPLFEFDNGKLISKFVKSYHFSPDYLTLSLELKEAYWSDGTKITTDDLAFSFNLFKNQGLPQIVSALKNAELKIIDNKKVEIRLTANDNYFLYNLSQLRILPTKNFAGIKSENFDYQLFDTYNGPFVLESLKSNKNLTIVTLKRNEFYQPKAYLEKIIFYGFPSVKAAFDAMILKEIDGLAGINYIDLPNNLFYNYKINKITLPRVIGIFFNSQQIDSNTIKALQNLNFNDEIRKGIFKGNAETTTGIFSKTWRQILNLNTTSTVATNTQQKTEIQKFNLISPNYYFYPEIARFLQEKLKIEIDYLDAVKLNEKLSNKNYQAILFGLNMNHPPNISSFFSKIGYNINNSDDANLEKLLKELATDPKINMNEKLIEIGKILQARNVFLINPYYIYLLNQKFIGFDQFFLPEPSQRFVKISSWYQK